MSEPNNFEWIKSDNPLVSWLQRWFDRHPRMKAKLDDLAHEAKPIQYPRCEWRTADSRVQCALRSGHTGLCVTRYINRPDKRWYGINYGDAQPL